MLAAGQEGVERRLLQSRADRGAHLRALRRHIIPGDAGAAGRRRQKRRQDVHRRRLAGAVRAEEAVDLSGRDTEVDPVDSARAVLELPDELARLDRVGVHDAVR